jgi:hypothetical protein
MSLSVYAQNTKLLIKDLMASKQMANMNVESLSYEPMKQVTVISGRGPGIIQMVYKVKKKMDNKSAKIEDAVTKGRTLPYAEVWITNQNGNMEKYKLSNVVLINYSALYENGKPPVEYFTLAYESRGKM